MIHIAICDDDPRAVQNHKDITESCLRQWGKPGKVTTYTASENLFYDITEDHFFFDLILLDIEMPGMSGIETFQRMKERGLDIPVIYLTASGHEDDVMNAIRLGAVNYLKKPFLPQDLMERIAKEFDKK